jgi:nicotinamidase-related amidase
LKHPPFAVDLLHVTNRTPLQWRKTMDGKNGIHSLLTPQNCAVIFIDHQPQMTFGVMSIDRQLLFNNVIGLAKAAKIFKVPVILTTVETKGFSGYMWPQLLEIFPDKQPIERTSMNSWEDKKFVAEVERVGKKKLVMAALWTEVCLAFPAIQAMEAGYEVYAVDDACGGTSEAAHRNAMQRIVQAGAVPVTWQQVLLEFQRDWAHKETYDAVMEVVIQHSGAYGQGVEYAYTMVHGQPPFPKRLAKPSH